MPSILRKLELDLATYLYNLLIEGKMSQKEAGEIAQKALENLPENTADTRLQQPLAKLAYSFPKLSSFFKQYLEEAGDLILENLRQQRIGEKVNG